MAREQIAPPISTLKRWREEGLSHAQMAKRATEETGVPVSRSAISVALYRAGLTKERMRYDDVIPWTLRGDALISYPVRMLRLLGRRRRGIQLNEEESRRLDQWLEKLRRENVVVACDPDSDEQVIYVKRKETDPKDLPVRKEFVKIKNK